jgi:hypothetical protein
MSRTRCAPYGFGAHDGTHILASHARCRDRRTVILHIRRTSSIRARNASISASIGGKAVVICSTRWRATAASCCTKSRCRSPRRKSRSNYTFG